MVQGPAVFLASDDSSYVTACVLNVTGAVSTPLKYHYIESLDYATGHNHITTVIGNL